MNDVVLEPLFIDGSAGKVFTLLTRPEGSTRCVVFVPPFAEEMNKCRRQVSVTAQALANAGIASVVFDPYGTGDSQGEFADATWRIWVDDFCQVLDFVEDNFRQTAGLITIRTGFLLALHALKTSNKYVPLSVCWQPVVSGSVFLNQFLRLKVAASAMTGEGGESASKLKQSLLKGKDQDIAGYIISPTMAGELLELDAFQFDFKQLGSIHAVEISNRTVGTISRPMQSLEDKASEVACPFSSQSVSGDFFWLTTEIVTNPELTVLTASHFGRH